MRVLVAGSNGSTGRRVVRRLRDGPHEPVAMIRDEDQRSRFTEQGLESVLADLEEPLDHAVEDCDAVVFCAGSGAGTGLDKTRAVDRDGAIRLTDEEGDGRIDAARELGRSGRIPRDDVADVLVACLDHENTDDRTFENPGRPNAGGGGTDGSLTPMDEHHSAGNRG